MKKRLLLICIILFCSSLNTFASDISGYAESINLDIAKSEALKNLKNNTALRVFSKYDRMVFDSNKEFIKSNYKLLTLFKYINLANLHATVATADNITKVTLTYPEPIKYLKQINATVKKIDTELKSIADENVSKKLKLFQRLLNLYDDYNLNTELLSILIVTDHLTPSVPYKNIIETIFSLQDNATSINSIAKYLTIDMDRSNVVIMPIISATTGAQTEFSDALKLAFEAIISTRSESNNDSKYLTCFYTDTLSDITISCDLADNNSKYSTSVAKISKKNIDNLEYKTKQERLVEKLNKPLASDVSLNILLRYIPETAPLFLSDTDYFFLQAKVNMPAFLQFVGYRMADNLTASDMAYIIKPSGYDEIFIGEENIDKWVTIGRYMVSKPLGDELIEVYGRTIKEDNITLDEIITDGTLLNTDILLISKKISSMYMKNIGEKNKAVLTINTARK